MIANRVPAPDGRWLALDARTIKLDQRTLSALYHANLRSELTRRLGVRWYPPEHGIAEIADFDAAVLAEFSQRSNDVQRRLDEKLSRFRKDLERDPTANERWKLEREAVVDSRPAKPHNPTPAELRQEWHERTRALGRDPERLVKTVVGRQHGIGGIDSGTAGLLVEEALGSLSERQSTWRPAELVRELAAAVPTTVTVDSEQLTDFLQRLADHAADTRCVDISRPVPTGGSLRRDGRPISEAAVDRTLTTQDILDEEEQLIAWADRRQKGESVRTLARDTGYARSSPQHRRRRWLRSPVVELGADRRSGRYRQDHHARLRRRPPPHPRPPSIRSGAHRRGSRSAGHRDRHDRRHPGQAAHRASPSSATRHRLRPTNRDHRDRRRSRHRPNTQTGRADPARRPAELAGRSGRGPPPVLSGGTGRHVRPPRRHVWRHRTRPGPPFPPPLGTPSQPPTPYRRLRRPRRIRDAGTPPRRHPRTDGNRSHQRLATGPAAGARPWR